MKRCFAFAVIALALGCTVAAQEDEIGNKAISVDAAKRQYRATEDQLSTIIEKLHVADGGRPSNAREPLREKIRPLVEESFNARQRLQQAEVEALSRRLAEINQAINDREKQRQAIIEARIQEILSGPPAGKQPGKVLRTSRAFDPFRGPVDESVAASGEIGSSNIDPRRRPIADDDHFDLETRERLAQLDVQAAEEEYQAAENKLPQVRTQYEQGAVPLSVILESEKDQRRAAIELKRAKLKLEGLARQRSELEAIADADVAEAQAELQRADAKVRTSEANREAAKADMQKVEANLEAAEAKYAFEEKRYQRIKKLLDDKAVDEKTVDEAEQQLAAAKAALAGVRAAVATAKANLDQTASAIEEMQAARQAALQRLRAATARRDRLNSPATREAPAEPAKSPTSGNQNR